MLFYSERVDPRLSSLASAFGDLGQRQGEPADQHLRADGVFEVVEDISRWALICSSSASIRLLACVLVAQLLVGVVADDEPDVTGAVDADLPAALPG